MTSCIGICRKSRGVSVTPQNLSSLARINAHLHVSTVTSSNSETSPDNSAKCYPYFRIPGGSKAALAAAVPPNQGREEEPNSCTWHTCHTKSATVHSENEFSSSRPLSVLLSPPREWRTTKRPSRECDYVPRITFSPFPLPVRRYEVGGIKQYSAAPKAFRLQWSRQRRKAYIKI